jgi:DNA-binding transcriptional LysR family regulator
VQLSIPSKSHVASLSRLEADLTLRLPPPIEDIDIIKKVGQMRFARYAGQDYPYANDDQQWAFVGYTDRQADFAHKRWLYDVIGSRLVACELSELSHQYEAACTGIAVVGLPCFIGDPDPRLIRLESHLPMLDFDIWVAMHPDSRSDNVVRHTAQAIAQLLGSCGLGLPSVNGPVA